MNTAAAGSINGGCRVSVVWQRNLTLLPVRAKRSSQRLFSHVADRRLFFFTIDAESVHRPAARLKRRRRQESCLSLGSIIRDPSETAGLECWRSRGGQVEQCCPKLAQIITARALDRAQPTPMILDFPQEISRNTCRLTIRAQRASATASFRAPGSRSRSRDAATAR